MIKKIKQDSIYGKMFEEGVSINNILHAGFFEDNHTEETYVREEDTLDIKCTPFHFLDKTKENPVVLLTTGSFNPIHDGHIQMMELAKQDLESKGFNVVGGYFAPDHDEYISFKLKEEAIEFNMRMKIILDTLKNKNIDWLTVDPWAGIFEPVAVNFTRIIHRLRLYLKKHYDEKVEVIYVCGSDHARFAHISSHLHRCVVVDRGIDNSYETEDLGYAVYIKGGSQISSTEIRKKQFSISKLHDAINLRVYKDPRTFSLIDLFNKHFKTVKYSFLSDQQEKIDELLNHNREGANYSNTINLDADSCLKHNLYICRNYDAFGIKSIGHTNRPGRPTIDEQISKIKLKDCYLFDDDIFTGNTIRFVREKLKEHGINNNYDNVLSFENGNNCEIADIKDFFFDLYENNNNVWASGLVINNKRYPYVYPYVSPFIRCSVQDPLSFSIEVWKINMDHYKNINDIKSYVECNKQYNSLLKLKNATKGIK